MKSSKVCLLVVTSALISFGVHAAGEKYRLVLSGTSETRDASGQVVTTPISSDTLITDCTGSTNNFVLAYERGASTNADFIEVVNTLNGDVFCIPLQLYPPTVYNNFDGNFVVVIKGDETEIRRIRYVFHPEESTHNVGTVYLTEKIRRNSDGTTNKTTFTGQFQYFRLASGTNGVRICNGTFTASQKLTP